MIDLLLNHLEEDRKEIDVEVDNIRFVGFGYGAFIIHCYCIFIILCFIYDLVALAQGIFL